jgi:DNA-binding transcriptional ArsR family regulator
VKGGEAVLHALVEEGGLTASEIAGKIGLRDGRSVSHTLRRLESAKLAHEGRAHARWWPTKRGEEVDAILDRITAERGGKFAPKFAAGITHTEALALNYGRATRVRVS